MNTRSQERKTGDCESPHLSLVSRHKVKPSDPGYDAHVLAHIKAKVVIDPVRGCWLWQGFVQPVRLTKKGLHVGGYGTLGYRGRNLAVHRVVWTLVKGEPAKKMDVCHECDVRHCCNPEYLWLGTRSQNLQDMARKGRGPCGAKAAKTICVRGHELSGDNVQLSNNGRRRSCKECDRILHRQPKYVEWARQYQRKRQAAKRAAREASRGR